MDAVGELTARTAGSAARVVEWAAVVGEEFWRGAVCAAAEGMSEAEVDVALWALAARGVVACTAGSRWRAEDTWRFTDAAVAIAAYEAMDAGARGRAHGAVARWLEARGELDAARVAAHLARSDRRDAAGLWCAEAARTAMLAKDFDGVLAWSLEALACGVDPTTAGAMWMLRVGVHDARGALDEAARCAVEGFREAPRGSGEWFGAAASLAVLSMHRLEPERFRELAPALDAALRESGLGSAPAGLASALHPLLEAGQYALADLLLERLEELLASGDHPDPTFAARVFAARAARAHASGEPRRLEEESRRAAAVFEAHDEPRFALAQWCDVGCAQLALGEAARAAGTLRSVVERAGSQGFLQVRTAARHRLGMALLFLGQVSEALALAREVVAEAEAIGDARTAALARLCLARAHLAGGDLSVARGLADAALSALRAAPGGRVLGLAVRAQAAHLAGDVAAALRDVGEAKALLETLGTVAEGEGLLRLVEVDALTADGRDADAARALAGAWSWLADRSARAGDARAQRAMVEGVPEHARIEVLARALGQG
jgi:hypothetical protein